MNRQQFIARYVRNSNAVGFHVTETEDGCIYEADGGMDIIGTGRFTAAPCDCGHCDGWGMFPQEELA